MRTHFPNDKGFISKAIEWFLELPVPLMLTVWWVVGVVGIGSCVLLALYVLAAMLNTIA
jgi:hypothetical protein